MLDRCSVLAAFATAAGIVIAATPAVAGAWVADAKSGCQVWNPNPQLEETVAWSGPCANGRAAGTRDRAMAEATTYRAKPTKANGATAVKPARGRSPGQPDDTKANCRTASPMVTAC